MQKSKVEAKESTPLLPAEELLADDKDAPLWERLFSNFGWRFLSYLSIAQHVVKGFSRSFVRTAFQYVMEEYGVKASSMGVYSGIVSLPWAMKPAVGLLSDTFPVYGYAKTPYLLLTTVCGIVALAVLGTVQASLAIPAVIMLLFCWEMFTSTVDLLTEATYARVLRRYPSEGPGLLSFVWGGMVFAGLFATFLSGFMLSTGSPWNIYLVAIFPASIVLLPTLFNWIGESQLSTEEIQEQRDRVWKQKEAAGLAFALMGSSILLTWSGLNLSTKQHATVSVCILLVILALFSITLNPIIAKATAFSLLQAALSVQYQGAAFYFAMDTPEAYPEGPHFSVWFYSTVLPLCGGLCTLAGIYVYNEMASSWTYPKMMIIGNLVASLVAVSDLIFYLRLNVKWGINDHVFVLGSASMESVIGQWLYMPHVVLLAQLCPKGMEAIMYANLAGTHNIGMSISSNIGAYLLELLEVNPSGQIEESKQFDNLWLIALIGIVMPLVPVMLVPWFIPNKLNTERIFDREDTPANEGSLWRRWTGSE